MSISSAPPAGLHTRAFLLLSLNIVFWAIGPLFVKYFADYYDSWTQNAFRYTAAALILIVWTLARRRRPPRLTRAQWGKLSLVALANISLQCVFARIYYYIYPSVASLIVRMDIFFVCFMAVVFFHDERRVIRSPRFIAGAMLAIFGLLTVIAGQDPELLERLNIGHLDFWIGVGLALSYAFFLAVYSLTVKRLVRDVDPIDSFTRVAIITALGLIALMFIFGQPAQLLRGPAWGLELMVLSALLCIVAAHTALYSALRQIKAAVATTLMMLTPVVTCALSPFFYHDRLSGFQIAGAVATLIGAWMAAIAQTRAARSS